MQLDPVRPAVTHLGDRLACLDLIALLDQQATIVGIGAQIGLIVLDDNHVTVTDQSASGVNNSPVSRSLDRLSHFTSDINSFIQTPV